MIIRELNIFPVVVCYDVHSAHVDRMCYFIFIIDSTSDVKLGCILRWDKRVRLPDVGLKVASPWFAWLNRDLRDTPPKWPSAALYAGLVCLNKRPKSLLDDHGLTGNTSTSAQTESTPSLAHIFVFAMKKNIYVREIFCETLDNFVIPLIHSSNLLS
jgi:hypothetical protein